MEKIVVTFKKAIFQSQQYGISIAVYELDKEPVTVTGMSLPCLKKVNYELSGNWTIHPKYGRQFKAESYEEVVTDDEESIFDYLTSGLIKGIGPATARKIIRVFGSETLNILDNDINRLKEVKGISEGKLLTISESYTLAKESRNVAVALRKYGIGPKLAQTVYSTFRSDSMDIINNRPYMLCLVNGISFVQADGIAEKTAEYCTSYERFKVCARYVLFQNEINGLASIIGNRTSGSICMDKNDFGTCMLTLLKGPGIDGKFVCNNTIQMIRDKELVYRKNENQDVLVLPGLYRIEQSIADSISRLCNNGVKPLSDIDAKIKEAEAALNVTLSLTQIKAVKTAFKYGLSVLTGPPGSGKSLVLSVIGWIYEKYESKNVIFLAPTGKAAARLRENKCNACTIHSGLRITAEKISDVEEEEIIYKNSLVAVDEFSMCDSRLASKLLSAIDTTCRIILCGDADQLPSVGAGSVLRDILDSKVPATKLDTVFRTSDSGNIYANCNLIRNGNHNLFTGNGFNFVKAETVEELEKEAIATYLRKIEKYGIEGTMLLSPYKDNTAGVNSLNKKIQQILNPDNVSDKIFRYGESYYRIGDPILNLVNDTSIGVVNGDVGTVIDITEKDGEEVLVVKFAESTVYFTKENCNDICLAYCMTVHKCQGSEAKACVLLCHQKFSLLQKRNLVYTAISRGKDDVTVVGQWDALVKAIDTEDRSKRITTLKEQLKMRFGEFVSITYCTA